VPRRRNVPEGGCCDEGERNRHGYHAEAAETGAPVATGQAFPRLARTPRGLVVGPRSPERPGGEHFDSFALDIESTKVGSVSARNRNLKTLSERIRARVGKSYPLGAIIPSPKGLSEKKGYWSAFPYSTIARYYDVFLPMAYYTYHTGSASGTRADALDNVRILKSQPGCSNKPIHLIGGISNDSSTAEVRAFARAAVQTKCLGASLYGWPGTSAAAWRELRALR
jgi:hypothetical protein